MQKEQKTSYFKRVKKFYWTHKFRRLREVHLINGHFRLSDMCLKLSSNQDAGKRPRQWSEPEGPKGPRARITAPGTVRGPEGTEGEP